MRVNLAVVDVAGLQPPVPELGLSRALGTDEKGSPPAVGAAPEAHCLVAGDDSELRLLADLHELREPDSERRRQAIDRGNARIRPALFELDDHALADARAGGQRR